MGNAAACRPTIKNRIPEETSSRDSPPNRIASLRATERLSMPVFRQNEPTPAWCELKSFEIIDLKLDEQSRDLLRGHTKVRVLCTLGTIQLSHGAGTTVLKENQFLDLHVLGDGMWSAKACAPLAQLVVLSGTWGDDMSGCGIFRVAEQPDVTNNGDPVDYPKKTRVDSHYHDCDEYWIILEGRATVVVGGRAAEVGPGDCVGIGMGHHHDMPLAPQPVKAVFFETTLEREKRIGHLWNHTHGTAQPHPERS
jgi:mannose-6-phosphate isomerase-like protein (cupin superfamily)